MNHPGQTHLFEQRQHPREGYETRLAHRLQTTSLLDNHVLKEGGFLLWKDRDDQ
jgi:hypothetical protein